MVNIIHYVVNVNIKKSTKINQILILNNLFSRFGDQILSLGRESVAGWSPQKVFVVKTSFKLFKQ